jgi:recombination protein RecT
MAAKSVNVKESVNVPAKANKKQTMMDFIKASQKQITKALPSAITPERFTRICMTAVTQNPDLGLCTPASFAGAMLTAAQLGLEPNTPLGQAYLIPFNNGRTGTKECQFQIGYRGLIELAHRSGDLQSIEAHIVYENDEFEYELGLNPVLKHKPAMENRGSIAWVYAVYKLKSGGYGFEVMSVEDINKHRDRYSQAARRGFSPWNDNWEEMAKKTVIKRVLKYAPMKTEFIKAMVQDDSTLNFEDRGDDFDIVQSPYSEEQIVEAEAEVINEDTGEIA